VLNFVFVCYRTEPNFRKVKIEGVNFCSKPKNRVQDVRCTRMCQTNGDNPHNI